MKSNDILNWKANKRMKALGVDKAAEEAFEREKKAGCARVGINTFVTENWLYYDSGLTSGLFPLKEVVSFQKGYTSTMREWTVYFHVRLFFKDGGNHKIPCDFEDLDDIAAVLGAKGIRAKRAQPG